MHTSPEFKIKELLSLEDELKRVYSLGYCFRDEPNSPIHRNQFLMLEWYRVGQYYEVLIKDCEEIIKKVASKKIFLSTKTMDEVFGEILNIKISDFLETNELELLLKKDFRDIPLPAVQLSWDDYFFLLFLNKIEPQLKNFPFLVIKEFPHHLSALSTIKNDNPKVCERFELYIHGIEVANAYNELTDLNEQKHRFKESREIKLNTYQYELPKPKRFYQTLERGLPSSCGIALGVERLAMALHGKENLFID